MSVKFVRIHPNNRVLAWIEERLPWLSFLSAHTATYYVPKNLNAWYYFGALALVVLVNQIATGIFLAMNFTPTAAGAFASVEYIMRDVRWGWLIRYMHSTGASLFFVVIYLHMFRSLLYGSFKRPRELVWLLGCVVLVILMAEAFMGYALPWGQMSFWGAKVIVSLFGAVPVVGNDLVQWIMGDYLPGDATIHRFFALHVVALPLALLLIVTLHILALHEKGSNNPDGVEISDTPSSSGLSLDGVPFHPYYTVDDILSTGVLVLIAAFIIFYAPTFGGWFLENDNFVPANNLVTPEHIKPVWYFTPFYAMLRAVPDKLAGVVVLGAAILTLFFLPWIDRGPVRSIRYRGLAYKIALACLAISVVGLGTIGAGASTDLIRRAFGAEANATGIENALGRVLTCMYFAFFVFTWIYTRFGWERTKAVPKRLTYETH